MSDALSSLIDVPATLATAAGLPASASTIADSQEHLSTWIGRDTQPRDYAVSMTSNRSLTLRTQHYKYISPSRRRTDDYLGPAIETGYRPTPQLFDLSRSDYEEKDVSAEKPKTLQRLQRLLGQVRNGE